MDRCMDGQMYGWKDVWMNRCMDEQMYGWTDVWMDRCMDGQTWYHCMPYCLSVNGRGITIFHICSNYYSLTN